MEFTFEECYTRVLNLIRRCSFITMIDLDDRVRLGMFYLMKIYGLGFRHCVRGSWEWLELFLNDGPGLLARDIEDMPMNQELYWELKHNHDNGIFPEGFNKQKESEKTSQEFGWLSPMGDFIESPWGRHLESAVRIIKKNGWEDEFNQWNKSRSVMCPENDFLCDVKGWALIHNPSNDGGYIVTHVKHLTNKQREFLYTYFSKMGNVARGEMYLIGEEL